VADPHGDDHDRAGVLLRRISKVALFRAAVGDERQPSLGAALLERQSQVSERPGAVHRRPAVARAPFAAGSLLLETLFPLVLFVPRLRWLFIPGAIAMHVGIRLATGLDYSTQWLTLLIVFVNWLVIVEWIRQHVSTLVPLREAPR
jgi:hypothetical protein